MKRILFIIAILFGAVTLHAQQANTAPKDTINVAKIVFEKTTHDYGKIAHGSDGTCSFSFKNTGKLPLVLSNVASSCGCTVPSWTKEPVLPGEKGEIKVKYNTNNVGVISKAITVTSNALTPSVILKIAGEVKPAVQATEPVSVK